MPADFDPSDRSPVAAVARVFDLDAPPARSRILTHEEAVLPRDELAAVIASVPQDEVDALLGLPPQAPAAPLSAEEVSGMRERWARVIRDVPVGALDKSERGERLGHLIGSDMYRLLDAVEALTAENARLERVMLKAYRLVSMGHDFAVTDAAYLLERNLPGQENSKRNWYTRHRRRAEAAHAAAKEAERRERQTRADEGMASVAVRDLCEAAGIDMALLSDLCREEPDEATKREVAAMMDKLNGGS